MKYAIIIGLVLDVLGVCILLYNEIKLRKIDLLRSKGVTNEQVKNATKDDWRRGGGTLFNSEAMDLAEKHNSKKAIILSRLGLILLLIGFLLQILGSINSINVQ
jgi:uncharacterized membrane protein